ncbi:hypothetical protein E2C01_023020 [Portunus trituberculatus]|uniref:Uncharacterized protein n=1 Tax=Portunus trituberculatus TaxID=210409 RepID=A0A5B7E6Y4_PORTR|nr:hypothetical protein [Portunus trituberculatus]
MVAVRADMRVVGLWLGYIYVGRYVSTASSRKPKVAEYTCHAATQPGPGCDGGRKPATIDDHQVFVTPDTTTLLLH